MKAIYKTADADMLPELKKLWKIAFSDDDEYIDLFLKYNFEPEHTHIMTYGKELAGAIYAIPFSAQSVRGRYLYAGAVFPLLRGNGIYSELIQNVCEKYRKSGIITALLPAPGLEKYYLDRGFDKIIYSEKQSFLCSGGKPMFNERIAAEEYYDLRNNAFSDCEPFIKWNKNSIEYSIKEAGILGGFADKIGGAGLIGYKDGDVLEIDEITMSKDRFLRRKDDIAATYGVTKIDICFPAKKDAEIKKAALYINGDIDISSGWAALTHE